ncbi:MAG: aminotransferase class I/II-fold pyridoxal phosphate-dependent enzyme [Clostridiales bacterium]|nr:aminotransferase class I/II-fold pyridoxal phosphate-dependent enzyme [Clostridiales bacterium]
MGLYEELMAYRDSDIYPMHMPGHKRRDIMGKRNLPFGLDITEIEGFDSLHDAAGTLKDAMQRAAELYHSCETFFLVNGSTSGILASIFAGISKGGKVLAARNSHHSIYNAISLRELDVVYLLPEYDNSFGIAGSISVSSVLEALKKHNDIGLIIITSPTYDGVVSDIRTICAHAHAHRIPVLVDEAHGSHFGFSPEFPESSVKAGADLVVHGLHKTLPCFTQSAILHVNGDLIDPFEIKKMLSVFQSSSPSYLLMAGIDSCIELLINRGEALFNEYIMLINAFNRKMKGLNNLRVFCKGNDDIVYHPAVYHFDPGKIVISCRNTSIEGPYLAACLLERYRIQTEMSASDYVVAMTSIADTREGFLRLGDALLCTDETIRQTNCRKGGPTLPAIPEKCMHIHEAETAKGRFYPIDKSAGKTSAEYVFAYPPGIPLIVPGEIVSEHMIGQITDMAVQSVAIKSTYGKMPKEIKLIG